MRFLFASIFFFFVGYFLCVCHADIRFAATPKNNYTVRSRENAITFTAKQALYLEPSTFGYAGLNAQRTNNYDNFLRSNIDNEQDMRNFNTEHGKDMLPFRTLEGASFNVTNQYSALFLDVGKEYVLPLRMNNPHAYEIELNIWINDNTIVVPIKKPVCAGEGYQDAVISFIIPTDFNRLGSQVVGFDGCNEIGDCVLQLYAHSVEPRAYGAAVPVIISGWDPSYPQASSNALVQPATVDPGTDLSKQPSAVCRSSLDPSSNFASAIPRYARHVSDVYNHAFQNSDYSPYSGQQHEAISKNLQAACILRMVNGNRGELGKSILSQQQKNVLGNLRNTVDIIVRNYETITNIVINDIFKNNAKSTGTVAAGTENVQKLSNCFRCAETGSVTNVRLSPHSSIPSFKISNSAQLSQARSRITQLAGSRYANLIDSNGVLQIYTQALTEVAFLYQKLQTNINYNFTYQPAQLKSGPATMPSPTSFMKINANGVADGGVYAATKAKQAREAQIAAGGIVNEYSFNDFDSPSILPANLELESLADFDLPVLNLFPSLSFNVDDDPAHQSGYVDREDLVEGLPIQLTGTDAELNEYYKNNTSTTTIPPTSTTTTATTTTTTTTTIPASTSTPTTTTTTTPVPVCNCSNPTLIIINNCTNTDPSVGQLSPSSSDTSISMNRSSLIGAAIAIGGGCLLIGILMGVSLSAFCRQKKAEGIQKAVLEMHASSAAEMPRV